jgi:LacI family transcriptional regulator
VEGIPRNPTQVAKISTMAHDILLALEWYDYRIHRGVARVAAREGWHLTCPSGRPGFQPVPEGWRGQGAIALAGDGWLTALRRRRVAVVDIGLSASQQVPRTVVDNQAVADVAFAFLRERGWRRLACVTVSGVRMLDERREAFVARAGAAGLPCPVWALEEVPRYLASAAPVAVFAVQDTLGAQVQAVARRLGLSVPAQVAILGVDDMDLICQALPVPLASVDTDQEGLGVAAAERLARILAGQPDNAGLIRHPPRGVVARASAEAFGTDHPGLRAALDLAHLDPACGIRALAAAAGLSPQGLDLVCQRELGLTPGILLRRLRLRRAGDHLAQGRSLDQAAAAAGMASASGLCAVVRRELGLTPAQWRRTLQC